MAFQNTRRLHQAEPLAQLGKLGRIHGGEVMDQAWHTGYFGFGQPDPNEFHIRLRAISLPGLIGEKKLYSTAIMV